MNTEEQSYTPKKINKNHEVLRQEFIKPRDLVRLYGINRSTVFRWIKSGRLPEPTRITCRIVGWNRDEIKKILEG